MSGHGTLARKVQKILQKPALWVDKEKSPRCLVDPPEDKKGKFKVPISRCLGVCILQRRRSKNINARGSGPNHPHGLSGVRSKSKIHEMDGVK